MDFHLSEEQSLFRDSARRFLEDNCKFDQRAPVVAKGGFDAGHWAMFAEMGLLGLAVPEDHGGLGYGPVETALVMEEIGRVLCIEPYWAIAVLAAQTLAAAGEGQGPLLAELVAGRRLPVVAHGETAARGRLEAVETRATPLGDGRWRLDGGKPAVVAGNVADLLIVSARNAGTAADRQGITLFLVAPDAAGLTRRNVRLVDNQWGADLQLDGVELGADAVLGEVGGGFPILDQGHAHGLVALCAEAVGVMEKALWITRDYLKTRKQFGQTLNNFQSLQHRMSEMLIELELSRSMVHQALGHMAAPPDERARALSATKAHIGKSGKFVCGQAIQLHGGIGVTEEYVIGHYFKRMTLIENALGSSYAHFERLAESYGLLAAE